MRVKLWQVRLGLGEYTLQQSIYDLDTPALLVNLETLERNITRMQAVANGGDKRLRPHVKTHKTLEIARLQQDAGAVGLTVAKVSEAEVFADAGFRDLFIANQVVGPIKIERLLNLSRRVSLRVGVDSREVAIPIGEAAQRAGTTLVVMLEADTGLGRAGTRSLAETLELARIVTEMSGLEFAGIFTHEGQLYRAADEGGRAEAAQAAAVRLSALVVALAEQGTPAREVSVGSTPGAGHMAHKEGPTELRPGTYVFNDRMQVKMGVLPEDCAVTVLATVTSVRPDGRIILDAGTKSLAGDSPFADKSMGEVRGHPDVQFVGASEEHGHLQVGEATGLRVGDKVQIVPNHVCTCVNMHETLFAYRNEVVEARWKIAARGKIT